MGFTLNLGNLQIRLLADNSSFAKTMRQTEAILDKTAKKMKKVGKTLTKYVTLPLTIMGAGSVKAFADFDSAMTQSLAIMSGVTPQIRKQMEDVAKTMASQGIKSADELAKSYFFLASAGLDAEQSMAALPVVTNFATAGMFDMAQATDLLTDAQSALGLTVKDSAQNMKNMTRVSDVLVKANTLANATVEQFSTALTTKAGTAMKSYNMDLEEGVAILAAYADQGIKSQLAGSMFDRMVRLTIKSINDNRQAFADLNIDVEEFASTGKNITGVIQGITQATKEMGPAKKAATLEMLGFEARSQQAILPLLGLSNNIRVYQKKLKEVGITQEIANKQLKSFSAQMKIVWNNVKLAAIEIGSVLEPNIISLGKNVKKLTGWFIDLDKKTQKQIVFWAALAAAIGPVLIGMSMFIKVGVIIGKVLIPVLIGLKAIAVTLGHILYILAPYIGIAAIFYAIALSVWVLVDAFMEADLRILKNLRSIQIGGTKLGDWWDAFGTYLWQTWDWVINKLALGWEHFKLSAMTVGNKTKIFFLVIGEFIANAMWTMIKEIGFGFTSFIKKQAMNMNRAGLMTDSLKLKIVNAANSMNNTLITGADKTAKFYIRKIKETTDTGKERWTNYRKRVNQLDKEGAESAAKWAAVRDRIFAGSAPGIARIKPGTEDDMFFSKISASILLPITSINILTEKVEELGEKYYDAIAIKIAEANNKMIESIKTAQPTIAGFLADTLSGIFELATDPEVQVLGQAVDQLKGIYQNRLQMLEDYAQAKKQIEERLAETTLTTAQQAAATEVALQGQKNQVMLAGASALLSASLSLLASGGKKAFKLYKALAIAEATIATYNAANKALASPPGPPWTYAIASAVIVTGLARVRQIARMQPGSGGGGGGGGGDVGAGGTAGVSVTPTERTAEGLGIEEEERLEPRDRVTIIIENVHGSADAEFARQLAQEIYDISGDGVDYGFETTSS